MKKLLTVFLFVLGFVMIISVGSAAAKQGDLPFAPEQQNSLPSSLLTIEGGAFEGTGLVNVMLPQGVSEIEENAFSVGDITIHAGPGSYARYWAEKRGFRFVLESFFDRVSGENPEAAFLSVTALKKDELKRTGSCFAEKQERRTGRASVEMKIARYQGMASEMIQSRFFP